MNVSSGILKNIDLLRIKANGESNKKHKSTLGQFFTSAPICEFMSSLFININESVNLLDPGCGVGSLFSSFIDEAFFRGNVKKINLTAYEIDESLQKYIDETIRNCNSILTGAGIGFSSDINYQDFILEMASVAANDLFGKPEIKFSHVIMNPPYKKISSQGIHRKSLRIAGIETVNLYSGFVGLAIRLLKAGGELVAIVPRSFCNGPYYLPFRELLLKETALKHIHIFDARNKAFEDDEVLQENIIIHCVKGKQQGKVTITSSPIADFKRDNFGKISASNMTLRQVEINQIIDEEDSQKIIRITPTDFDQSIINRLSCFRSSLEKLDIQVSTGPVVGFRLKQDLRQIPIDGSVPLLFPTHLNHGVQWPKKSKKPNSIMVSKNSKKWLWKNKGYFVLTRRFSSKDEKRRIYASVYDSSLPGKLIGFDNKLNVFHKNKLGLNQSVANGLYLFLNSSLVDKYYRQIGGHTQVNATDLRSLKYPNLEMLIKIGKNINIHTISQEEIDKKLDWEINQMTENTGENPLDVQKKIDQALELIVELGIPRAQQNDRSALTILALLNLQPHKKWKEIESPLIGVTPIMDWCRENYGKNYAPNTRETFRRQTLHQFIEAGIIQYNPDNPNRAVNSPKACYQISQELYDILKFYQSKKWKRKLKDYLEFKPTLIQQYAKIREMAMIPLQISEDEILNLSPGDHSALIKSVINEFGPRFAPGAEVIYIGDTGGKTDYFKKERLEELGVIVDDHGKMPDVVLFFPKKGWIFLVEVVTSHGPVDSMRHKDLSELFNKSNKEIVYVSAFPNKKVMTRFLGNISWETEVWIADAPSHMIHFNGGKFLGPH